jgi:hypothetical protein
LSQQARRNERLAAALLYEPARPIERVLLFELATWNPIRGQGHYLELWHEVDTGEGKFAVYLDGRRWRNGWSVSRFAGWMARQIDRVKLEWD